MSPDEISPYCQTREKEPIVPTRERRCTPCSQLMREKAPFEPPYPREEMYPMFPTDEREGPF